jgi:hypothetical protein
MPAPTLIASVSSKDAAEAARTALHDAISGVEASLDDGGCTLIAEVPAGSDEEAREILSAAGASSVDEGASAPGGLAGLGLPAGTAGSAASVLAVPKDDGD